MGSAYPLQSNEKDAKYDTYKLTTILQIRLARHNLNCLHLIVDLTLDIKTSFKSLKLRKLLDYTEPYWILLAPSGSFWVNFY